MLQSLIILMLGRNAFVFFGVLGGPIVLALLCLPTPLIATIAPMPASFDLHPAVYHPQVPTHATHDVTLPFTVPLHYRCLPTLLMTLCVTPRVLECLSLAFALGIKTRLHEGETNH